MNFVLCLDVTIFLLGRQHRARIAVPTTGLRPYFLSPRPADVSTNAGAGSVNPALIRDGGDVVQQHRPTFHTGHIQDVLRAARPRHEHGPKNWAAEQLHQGVLIQLMDAHQSQYWPRCSSDTTAKKAASMTVRQHQRKGPGAGAVSASGPAEQKEALQDACHETARMGKSSIGVRPNARLNAAVRKSEQQHWPLIWCPQSVSLS